MFYTKSTFPFSVCKAYNGEAVCIDTSYDSKHRADYERLSQLIDYWNKKAQEHNGNGVNKSIPHRLRRRLKKYKVEQKKILEDYPQYFV